MWYMCLAYFNEGSGIKARFELGLKTGQEKMVHCLKVKSVHSTSFVLFQGTFTVMFVMKFATKARYQS